MTLPLDWGVEEALDRLATLQGIAAGERLAARERVIDAVGIAEAEVFIEAVQDLEHQTPGGDYA